ncbi:BrnT family toxin [Sphingomonas morindae]|uniref:BrnT family toxin n=1 Tax=Sphingomonas morindae TaxID=1541170 RepID=A0ABY4X3J2_9SPHN|nr:BrnT family toxin [Sphingomonas morindae]USI71457.1 BrnT family toxin [Sphingomonas morindae]
MEIDFDPAKNIANIATHGLSFADFDGFDDEPVVVVDDRHDYGEVRYRAFGRVNGKGRCLVFVVRDGRVRAISLRRARAKEMRRYGY